MDSLLDDMAGEGRLESQGHFTIDSSKIRERYESFQKETPRYFLARLLQGIVELEPQRITVAIQRQKLVLRAESPAVKLSLQNVSNLFEGVTPFSQGLLTSFLAGCLELDIRSDKLQLRLRPEEAPKLSSIIPQSSLELHLTFARPKGLLGLLTGRAKENAAIHSFLTYNLSTCSIPFVLDGRPINGSPITSRDFSPYHLVEYQISSDTLSPSQTVWGDSHITRPACYRMRSDGRTQGEAAHNLVGKHNPPHYHGVLFVRLDEAAKPRDTDRACSCSMIIALRRDMPNHSLLYVVDRGVLIETIDTEMDCPGLVAVISAAKLSKDASGLRVIRDRAYDQLLDDLKIQASLAFRLFESLRSWEKTGSGIRLASEELGRAQLAYGV